MMLVSYDIALELQPNNIEVINNKGLLYVAISDYNNAVKCFNQSTDINPSDASIWNYKGLAFHALGKYEDAITSYDKAIILRHTFVEAINNRESSEIQIKRSPGGAAHPHDDRIGAGRLVEARPHVSLNAGPLAARPR